MSKGGDRGVGTPNGRTRDRGHLGGHLYRPTVFTGERSKAGEGKNPDWEPLPKKSLKATGRARQKEVSRAKALEVEYSSARRGPSSTLYFVKN